VPIFFFDGYIFFDSLCLRDKKKISEQKKKIPFSDLRFFYLSRGEREGEGRKTRREKTKKEQYTHRANSNLPGESIARKRKRVLLFINRGKSPLFYKKQYQK